MFCTRKMLEVEEQYSRWWSEKACRVTVVRRSIAKSVKIKEWYQAQHQLQLGILISYKPQNRHDSNLPGTQRYLTSFKPCSHGIDSWRIRKE